MFGAPQWLPRTIVVLLAIGFVPAVIFSWGFRNNAGGIEARGRCGARGIDHSADRATDGPHDHRGAGLGAGYFAFDKFVLAPRREAALVAGTAPNESRSVINAKSFRTLKNGSVACFQIADSLLTTRSLGEGG